MAAVPSARPSAARSPTNVIATSSDATVMCTLGLHRVASRCGQHRRRQSARSSSRKRNSNWSRDTLVCGIASLRTGFVSSSFVRLMPRCRHIDIPEETLAEEKCKDRVLLQEDGCTEEWCAYRHTCGDTCCKLRRIHFLVFA